MAINNTVENINNQPTIKPRSVTGIFTKYIAKTLPLAFDESMSYYECLCALLEYLNETIVPDINNVNSGLGELQTFYEQLQSYVNNYFDNLDVQDEINNKLDAMVEDGSLTNLIKNYVDPIQDAFESDVNSQLNRMNTKIDKATSGSPLVASSISGMTDTSRVYVNTTDGKWYYYDGDSWEIGGVYLATEFANDTIPSASIKNVVFDKIDGDIHDVELVDSLFSNLTGCTYVHNQDGSYTFTRTSKSSMAQFRINIPLIDITRDIRLIFNVSNCKVYLNRNILKGGYITGGVGTISNGISYVDISKENLSSTLVYVFTLYENQFPVVDDGDEWFTLNSLAYTYSDIKEAYLNNNLSSVINNLNNYSKYSDIKNYLFERKNWFAQGGWAVINKFESSNNGKDISFSSSSNSIGIQTGSFTKTDSYLYIKGNISMDENSTARIYFVAYEADNTPHYHSTPFNTPGEIDLVYDLAYYAVYENMTHWKIIINNETANKEVILTDFDYYTSDIVELPIYSDNLEGVIKNVQSSLDTLSTRIENISSEHILTSPNGTKYKLGVTNNGTLFTIPIQPSNGVFIGNSLLTGFGNHGMASYSVNDDYYHYVTEYLRSKNENFVSQKVRAAEVESATNESAVNNWFNNTLDSALSENTDFVLIQLGDNSNTEEKIEYLKTSVPMIIQHIRSICPNAIIYWVGCWYSNTTKINNISKACADNNVKFINISSTNKAANQAYIGYEYLDQNGNTQTITQGGVASHPSSIGMKAISDIIIDNLDI